MQLNIAKEVAALRRLSTKELRERYAVVFGEATWANNKVWLIKRIAWRLQAQAEGDLSARARQRNAELARDADLRLSPPKLSAVSEETARTHTAKLREQAGNRLPLPGTILTRIYKGETLRATVLERGVQFEGQVFSSLSALARHITGSHCSGHLFFRLRQGVAS
jgi:hypothetical protein